MVIHVVQPGETIYSIAGRYGVDPTLLREDNGVPAEGSLAVGQTLVIQTIRTFHIVQSGETLSDVAGTTVFPCGPYTATTTGSRATAPFSRGRCW